MKLAGTLFVYNGNKFDYCYKESIQCLLEFCDKVFIVAGGDDNTHRDCCFIADHNFEKGIVVKHISEEDWSSQTGKEKLNYFTNKAIELAQLEGYEYQFNLQADEIVHEKSYPEIRKAIETDQEGFMCTRINLWGTPYLKLDVPQERKPCSTSIIRLTKTKYRSVDDAENISIPIVNFDFENKIDIWHYGFVRDRKIMKQKVIHIQEEVFGVDHDKKLDGVDEFIPDRWFSKTDLKIIDYPHPKIIQDWVKTRP